MPLSSAQREALTAKAREMGVDAGELIAEAESIVSGAGASPSPQSAAEKPKLFMYLLPFVTVREVRENWLGLSESFPGDGEVAAAWALKHGGGSSETPEE